MILIGQILFLNYNQVLVQTTMEYFIVNTMESFMMKTIHLILLKIDITEKLNIGHINIIWGINLFVYGMLKFILEIEK